ARPRPGLPRLPGVVAGAPVRGALLRRRQVADAWQTSRAGPTRGTRRAASCLRRSRNSGSSTCRNVRFMLAARLSRVETSSWCAAGGGTGGDMVQVRVQRRWRSAIAPVALLATAIALVAGVVVVPAAEAAPVASRPIGSIGAVGAVPDGVDVYD